MEAEAAGTVPCPYCVQTPCCLDQGLYESIVAKYDTMHEDNESPTAPTNKKIRFELYRHATSWMHGYLGKGVRIELPQCVTGEIMELAPAEPGTAYVGFKESATDAKPDGEEPTAKNQKKENQKEGQPKPITQEEDEEELTQEQMAALSEEVASVLNGGDRGLWRMILSDQPWNFCAPPSTDDDEDCMARALRLSLSGEVDRGRVQSAFVFVPEVPTELPWAKANDDNKENKRTIENRPQSSTKKPRKETK